MRQRGLYGQNHRVSRPKAPFYWTHHRARPLCVHAEDKSLIASTTKIMTALVICEAGDLDRTVVIPPEAVGIEGSSMYLKAGEVLSMHELLYGLMLRSGNDAAVALALADSGSISAFAMRMNEKAAVLGLKNTHYANPHGLDSEENYSTALDLARLTRFALAKSRFCAARLDEIRHHWRPRPDQPQQTSMAIFRRDRRKDRLYPDCGPDSGRRGRSATDGGSSPSRSLIPTTGPTTPPSSIMASRSFPSGSS